MEEPGLSFGQLEAVKKRSKWGQFEDGNGTSDAAPAGAEPIFSEMTENQQIAYAMRMSMAEDTDTNFVIDFANESLDDDDTDK